jgi:hypothetical protein
MAARPPVELSIDQRQIVAVGKAIKAEADGKALRRELIKAMRGAGEPLVGELKSSALAIPADGALREGEPLRPAIARAIKPAVRLSGQNTGLTVKASRVGVRGFSMAARRMNSSSFRRRVFGRDVWVEQTGREGWFDDTVKGRREEIRHEVMRAVDRSVAKLASQTRGTHPR